MSKKKTVDLFIVYLVSFIGLFCRVDYSNVGFDIYFTTNTVYATEDEGKQCEGENIYIYNSIGRENCKDKTLVEGGSATEKLEWISVIPGVGSFVTGFNYLTFAFSDFKFELNSIKKLLTGEFLNELMMAVGNVVDVLNPNPDEGKSALGFDKVFMSNLYCKSQMLYEENKNLISKSNTVTKGGLEYPMFPIYPLSIGINKETGLCDLDGTNLEPGSFIQGHQFNDYFKLINIAKGSARSTKCAFSYSPTSKQCIDQLTNPMLISYEAQSIIVSGICLKGSKKNFKTASGKADAAKETFDKQKKNVDKITDALGDIADETTDVAKKKVDELKEIADELSDEAKKKLDELEKLVSEGAEDAKEKIKELADDVIDEAEKKLGDLKEEYDKAANLAKKAQNRVSGHKLDIATSTLGFFTDERLIYDPVSLLGILTTGFVMEFVIDSIVAIIPNIFNIAAMVEELTCIGAGVAGFEVFKGVSESVIEGISNTNYKKAKKAIKNYTFCGYDWLTYQRTADEKYFRKGVYTHSYYKKVYDCINAVGDGSECDAVSGTGKFIDCSRTENKDKKECSEDGKFFNCTKEENKNDTMCNDSYACSSSNKDFCTEGKTTGNNKITRYSRHVKNRVFREYIYGGREYDAGTIEQNITKEDKKNDNRFVRFFQNLGEDVTTAVKGQTSDRSSLFTGDGYDPIYCIDPRTPEQKGFESLTQRYYMRGNEKANFACSRFVYDGNSACILHSSKVAEGDKNKMIKYAITSNNNKESNNYYLLPNDDKELINRYSKSCQEMFAGARDCCKQRSRHLICLVKKPEYSNECLVSESTGKDEICLDKMVSKAEKSTFCFANVVEEYSAENRGEGNNLMMFVNAVQNDGDFFKWTCELDGVKFEASKREGTNHVCVFSYGFCPYDFKLNAGLNYRATYCDADYLFDGLDANNVLKRTSTHLNVDDCRKGIFGAEAREEYKSNTREEEGSLNFTSHVFNEVSEDMKGFNNNDFSTIYDLSFLNRIANNGYKNITNDEMLLLENMFGCDSRFELECQEVVRNTIMNGYTKTDSYDDVNKEIRKFDITQDFVNNFRTSAYGQIKNFCQYMAHCVEVEEERLLPMTYNYSTLFMDSSCNGGGSNNSRNIFQGNTGGLPKQLSAPIVECIHESLNNLVNGVSGSSLCTEGHDLNNDGFCDSDTEESVAEAIKTGNTQFLKKYDTAPGSNAIIIKGYPLPDNYNPFLRLQKSFIGVIRAALSLFLVAYFYKLFFSGKIGDFTSPENISKLVFNLFKFSIVIWLIFYNGWQQGIYKKIVKFSTDAYTFVNNNFSKAINTPNNQILHLKYPKTINIVKQDPLDSEKLVNYRVCYRYDYTNNIKFGAVNEVRGVCERGYSRKNSSEIIVKSRGKSENKQDQKGEKLVISSNQEISALIAFIDEYNSTHSDKLYTQGLEGLNKSVDNEYLNNGEYEKEYIWNKYYDGCYFDPSEYKDGKSYLSIFDTLDCKMVRYLGYSTDKMVPNLIIFSLMLVIPNYLFQDTFVSDIIAGLGSMLFGALMSFMFIMFNVLIKTVYMFLSSFFTLSVLVFVSPVILPLMFYERTKKMVDTWLGMIMDSVVKPVFNLSMMMIYVNIMDKILLKGAIFIKHDFRGRGPSLYCYEGSISSFVCIVNSLLNGMGGSGFFNLLERLFNNFLPFLADILIVILLFMMSDSVLSTIDSVVKSIFQLGKTASVSNMSGKGSVAGSEGQSTEDVIFGRSTGKRDENGNIMREGGAMGLGKSINTFRSDYLAKAPGTALDSFINATTDGGSEIYNKGFNNSVKDAIPYSKLDSVKEAEKGTKAKTFFGNVGKVIGNGVRATGRGAAHTGRLMGHIGRGLGRARNFAGGVDDWVRNISTRGKNKVEDVAENMSKKLTNLSTKAKGGMSNTGDRIAGFIDRKIAESKQKKINELEEKMNLEVGLTKDEMDDLERLRKKYAKYQSKLEHHLKEIGKRNKKVEDELFRFNKDYDKDKLEENLRKVEKREKEEEEEKMREEEMKKKEKGKELDKNQTDEEEVKDENPADNISSKEENNEEDKKLTSVKKEEEPSHKNKDEKLLNNKDNKDNKNKIEKPAKETGENNKKSTENKGNANNKITLSKNDKARENTKQTDDSFTARMDNIEKQKSLKEKQLDLDKKKIIKHNVDTIEPEISDNLTAESREAFENRDIDNPTTSEVNDDTGTTNPDSNSNLNSDSGTETSQDNSTYSSSDRIVDNDDTDLNESKMPEVSDEIKDEEPLDNEIIPDEEETFEENDESKTESTSPILEEDNDEDSTSMEFKIDNESGKSKENISTDETHNLGNFKKLDNPKSKNILPVGDDSEFASDEGGSFDDEDDEHHDTHRKENKSPLPKSNNKDELSIEEEIEYEYEIDTDEDDSKTANESNDKKED